MQNLSLQPHERELRLLNEIRRALGRLEKGDTARATAELKKALNECEPSCTKKRRF